MIYPKVNKEHAREWVAALRSGNYTQCTEALYKRTPEGIDTNCCLGVVCEVMKLERNDSWEYIGYGHMEPDDGECAYYDSSGDHLPKKAQDWLGVDVSDPVLGTSSATSYNDTIKLSFAEIADLIETNWGLKEAPEMSQVVPEVVAQDVTPIVHNTYAKRAKRYIIELKVFGDDGKPKWQRSGSIPQAFKTYEEAEAAVTKNPAGFMGGDRRIRTK